MAVAAHGVGEELIGGRVGAGIAEDDIEQGRFRAIIRQPVQQARVDGAVPRAVERLLEINRGRLIQIDHDDGGRLRRPLLHHRKIIRPIVAGEPQRQREPGIQIQQREADHQHQRGADGRGQNRFA